MNQPTTTRAGELVPISVRVRYMEFFRVALVVCVDVVALAAPDALNVAGHQVALYTAVYATIAFAAHLVWRFSRRGGLALFGGMLITDGIYLAWTAYATGGPTSPLRYLIVLHLMIVALIASYRTGLKLALWHTLLLLVVFYAQRGGILHPSHAPGIGIGTPFQRLLEFSGVFWLVAIVTSSFTAVNERELRRRRYDLEALAGMVTRLESAHAPSEVADGLVESVTDTFDFTRSVLLRLHEDSAPSLLAWHGDVCHAAPVSSPGAGSTISAAAAARQTLLVSSLDPAADPWLTALLPDATNLVVCPLQADGRTIGLLVGECPQRMGARIEHRVVAMVERFASYGALALNNAWLLERVQQMAATDGLTGVANRRTFEDTLNREIARASRRDDDLSLLMIDIDFFKRLNDAHGHQMGDAVLCRVAAMLAAECREFDTVARYGGEEFAVVLPSTTSEQAVAIGDRLRVLIAEGLDDPRVTVSIGSATYPGATTDATGLIAAADEALYASKRDGRDRVTSAPLRLRVA
jgi:two-component system cell cycle response regulator